MENLTLNDVKTFLNYSDDFWNYINQRVSVFNSDDMIYAVFMKCNDDGALYDIYVIVPEVTDLKSALINIHEYKHAYDLYNLIGKNISKETEIFEYDAKELEKKFLEYFSNKDIIKLLLK